MFCFTHGYTYLTTCFVSLLEVNDVLRRGTEDDDMCGDVETMMCSGLLRGWTTTPQACGRAAELKSQLAIGNASRKAWLRVQTGGVDDTLFQLSGTHQTVKLLGSVQKRRNLPCEVCTIAYLSSEGLQTLIHCFRFLQDMFPVFCSFMANLQCICLILSNISF